MKKDPSNEADALRSDIDTTRRRMDDTMDALGDRLQPRHLLDEVLGYFRGEGGNGDTRMTEMREKISRSASSAVHGVVDTVKQNPLPALVIGAGIAWLIFESRRKGSGSARSYASGDYSAEIEYDPDVHYDRPLEYPTPRSDGQLGFDDGNGGSGLKDKASAAAEGMKEKISNLGDTAKDKLSSVKQRAAELGGRAKEKAGAAYSATRERVATTADQHPLEVGLCCLAAGLLAGLALPTPQKVNRIAGPTADRLRQRAREAGSEMVDKGKRVVRAAASAVQDEAKAQGFTPERLRDQAGAVAQRAGNAAGDAARREYPGAGEQEQGVRREENADSQTSSDPSSARPVT
ncbi:MAG TPA: DUF3618 domain-containing protein [Opitutaceae bacterium]|nr:DUF3618 domain-containing protein [Opitutaceae bacterium]